MHITFEGDIFARQVYGGISRYFAEIASQFIKKGHSVTSVCPLSVNHYTHAVPELRTVGLDIPNFRKSNRARIAASGFLASLLPLPRSDIIHETYYGSYHRKYKSPVVITVHDMIYEKTNYAFHDREFLIKAKRKCIERADRIICVSEWTRKDLIEVYPSMEPKTITVHHGTNIPAIGEQPHGRLPETPFLLFVGLRDSYKNFKVLIEAVGILQARGVRVPLVAFGGPEFSIEERRHFAMNGVQNENLFHFRGSDNKLAWLYQNASAFVFPSCQEGFGIPLLEAMSLGCPVICSNASCFPEIAQDAALYFSSNSSESLAECIIKIYSDSGNLKSTLVAKGYLNSLRFTWNSCADKTLQVYTDV